MSFSKSLELENIHYKYERLTSLIGILQMFTAEIVEIAGAPSNSLNDALFEIELELQENNEQFKNLILQHVQFPPFVSLFHGRWENRFYYMGFPSVCQRNRALLSPRPQ